jgi:hypothetical protein
MAALEDFFKRRLPDELRQGSVNARVTLLGSADVARPITGNTLGIYLHRLTVDPHGRNRFAPPRGAGEEGPRAELPVNLHFLLIAAASSASIEADLMGWAMVELANEAQLDISELGESDSAWSDRELVTVAPEEMSTEDLMRIWDVFEAKYTITVPYVIRSVRLLLNPQRTEGPAVLSRIYPAGVV